MIYRKLLGHEGSKPILVRNPLALPTSRTWHNTHEKWQQSGFIQPNVDPYSNLQQGGGFIQTNVDPYWY